jgi:hypothetical protein
MEANTARIIDISGEPEITEIKVETQKYLTPISIFHVVDSQSMTMADNTIKDINSRLKAIDDKLEPKKKVAYQAYKEWLSLIDELKKPYEDAKKYLQGEGKKYLEAEERKRREEEARLREEARKAEEERRLAEAEQAEKEGHSEEAEAILEEEIYVPPPVVEKTVPKVDNRLFQKRWKGRGVNIQQAIKFINDNPSFNNLLMFNEPAINALARSMKGKSPVPGIEFLEE